MLPFEITPATVIILLIIIALVALVIYRVRKKGMCDCKDCHDETGKCNGCGAVDKMLKDMDTAVKKK